MRKVGIILLLFLIIEFSSGLLMSAGIMLCNKLGMAVTAGGWSFAITLFVVNLLILLAVYFYLRIDDKRPLANHLALPSFKEAILAILSMITLSTAISGISELLKVPDIMQSQFADLMSNPLGILAICLVGPIAEEMTFRRGIMGSLLETEQWRKWALLISAAIFGIIHFNPVQVVCAFTLGLFLGWLYMKTHSLILPILGHIVNNSLGTLLSRIYGYDSTMQDQLGGQTALIITIILCIAVTAAFIYILNKTLRLHAPQTAEIKE